MQLDSSADSRLVHPIDSYSVQSIRNLILGEILKVPEIDSILGGHAAHALPYYFDTRFPERPKTVSVSHMPNNPYATLGGWKIFFGRRPNESIIDPVPYPNIQCLIYDKVDYMDMPQRRARYTRIVIDVRRLSPAEPNNPTELKMNGWYIQDFVANESVEAAQADYVTYLSSGGIYSGLKYVGAGKISTAIVDFAFQGRVMRRF